MMILGQSLSPKISKKTVCQLKLRTVCNVHITASQFTAEFNGWPRSQLLLFPSHC